jgi:predicted nucleic acid-binding protein
MKKAICVDSSAWIEHFRGTSTAVKQILEDDVALVRTHDLIILELALGGIKQKGEKIELIAAQQKLPNVTTAELLQTIETHGLAGTGIGCVDAHILASCLLTDTRILTSDTKLAKLAKRFNLL